ncbi:hypothetical protein D3C87_1031030 [compost metagenome]
MADQGTGVTGIPLQRALKARVIEPGQRQIHLTAEPAKPRHHVAPQVFEMRERLALDVIQQPHMDGLAADLE